MDELHSYFISLIQQTGSVDMADAEFHRTLADDPELRKVYREWCHEVGSTEKHGFLDFCDEYLAGRESVWDTLSDYDE